MVRQTNKHSWFATSRADDPHLTTPISLTGALSRLAYAPVARMIRPRTSNMHTTIFRCHVEQTYAAADR